jgi:hypothetical protein
MNKVKLFEKFIKQNTILFFDERVYNKWDDNVDLLNNFPKDFQKYMKDLLQEKQKHD